jgi:DNA-binding transcriptional ArsR family regulator
MDYDTFFSSQRWAILDIIARKPSSPVEISEKLGTSVSYVSQQLKLLEAASLVVKTRTGAADKGKPRMLFSIAKEIAHVALLVKGQPEKKKMVLDDHHKIILNIWMLEKKYHRFLERLYWKVEEDLADVGGIYFDSSLDKGKVILVCENKKVLSRAENYSKENKEVSFLAYSFGDFRKLKKDSLRVIHDPSFILMDEKNLKGGIEKKDEKQKN